MAVLHNRFIFTVNIPSDLYWTHCNDLKAEGKFTCSSEDLKSSNSAIGQQVSYQPYIIDLPKTQFANALREPNNGYIEPCYTFTSNSTDPENLPSDPKSTKCLQPNMYFCKKEVISGKQNYPT